MKYWCFPDKSNQNLWSSSLLSYQLLHTPSSFANLKFGLFYKHWYDRLKCKWPFKKILRKMSKKEAAVRPAIMISTLNIVFILPAVLSMTKYGCIEYDQPQIWSWPHNQTSSLIFLTGFSQNKSALGKMWQSGFSILRKKKADRDSARGSVVLSV